MGCVFHFCPCKMATCWSWPRSDDVHGFYFAAVFDGHAGFSSVKFLRFVCALYVFVLLLQWFEYVYSLSLWFSMRKIHNHYTCHSNGYHISCSCSLSENHLLKYSYGANSFHVKTIFGWVCLVPFRGNLVTVSIKPWTTTWSIALFRINHKSRRWGIRWTNDHLV